MKKLLHTIPLTLLLAAAPLQAYPVIELTPENTPASAPKQEAPLPETPETRLSEETLHQELRQLRDHMQTALNKRDLDALLDGLTDDVVFTTMNGDRIIGKEQVRGYYEKMLGGSQPVVKTITAQFEADKLSHLYDGGNTAFAFGRSNDHYELAGGETWEVKPQWSATIVRQNGRWLIAGFHYSVNMLDNPVLSAQRNWLMGGGAVAALLACAAGFLLGRRTGRLKK